MQSKLNLTNFINGEFVEPLSKAYVNNYNPSTGEVYSYVPDSNAEDVDNAVKAAKKAFPAWRSKTFLERSAILNKIADGIEARLQEFAEAESRDQGKPVQLAKSLDIPRAAYNFRFFAGYILYLEEKTYMTDTPVRALNYTVRSPLGVAGLISPWNLPLYLLTWKIAPAIAFGNTCVCKPSEITSYTAWLLCQVMKDVGVPAGVVNIVFGTGPNAGSALVSHPSVPLVSFTGGTKTGEVITKLAAPLNKKLSLELGGKNPSLVFDDCNLEECVTTSVRSSFNNQGEICLCNSRIYVQSTIYQQFVSKFVEKAKNWKVGDPAAQGTDMGALVSAEHLAKIEYYVNLAREEGGKIELGGKRAVIGEENSPLRNGYFYEPTIITGLSPQSRVMKEEIFGPVVTICPFDTEEQALEYANDNQYGLSSSLWTQNLNRAHNVAARIEAGIVWVNCWMIRDLRTPFGGQKASGVGREGGEFSYDCYTELKTVCIKFYSANVNNINNVKDPANWVNASVPSSYSDAVVVFFPDGIGFPNYLYSRNSTMMGSITVTGNVVFDYLNVINITLNARSTLMITNTLYTNSEYSQITISEKSDFSFTSQSPVQFATLITEDGSYSNLQAPLINITKVTGSGYVTLNTSVVGITTIDTTNLWQFKLYNSQLYVPSDFIVSNYLFTLYIHQDVFNAIPAPPPMIVAGNIFLNGYVEVTTGVTGEYYLLESQNHNISGSFSLYFPELFENAETEIRNNQFLVLKISQVVLFPSFVKDVVVPIVAVITAIILIVVGSKLLARYKKRSQYININQVDEQVNKDRDYQSMTIDRENVVEHIITHLVIKLIMFMIHERNIYRFSLFILLLINVIYHCKSQQFNDAYIFKSSLNCTVSPGCSFDDPNSWQNGTTPIDNSNVEIMFDVTSGSVNYIYSNGSTLIGNLLISGVVVFENLKIVSASVQMYSNLTVNSGLVTSGNNSHFYVGEKAALSLYLSTPIVIGSITGAYGSECYFMSPLLNFTSFQSTGYLTLTNSSAGIANFNIKELSKLSLVSSDLYVATDLILSNYTELSIYREKFDELVPPIVAAGSIYLSGWIDISEDSIDKSKQYNIMESQSSNITGKFQQQTLLSDGELDITGSSRYLTLSFPANKLPPSIIFLIVLFSLIFLVIASFLVYVIVKCCRERKRRARYSSLN
ncbi:aldehyde dehydrogenase [Heterostelium album PN500]|uniref:Aldehyde dehydrogenase n=1 Tax=Heterostelium pallidum (strain ATCC 26659 / Pp 5 / PN500) TaxID=670386 RepID=D3BAA7_HETP5|nr:aldehyde dehydrogenase [Heterostelium album PN500]EFA81494.1 aldehyde dehydrogenase [Heterostelium album PN500]|eukprot:XP_020433612.1 aldehyde dehydrogenase [Heterostelium album PN500]